MRKFILCLSLVFGAMGAFAQEAAPAAAASGTTFGEMFAEGGSLMWVLVALSVFAIADVAYLFAVLREGVTVPRQLKGDVLEKIQAGDLEAARKMCDYQSSPFSRVALVAVDAASNLPDGDASVLNGVVEGEGARQATRLQGLTQWLLDIASIAPMVGLLGTVLGMFTAFQGVGGDMAVSAKPVVLAQGVSLALITTISGLLVAIPCSIFYAIFRRRALRQVAALECAAADLVTAVLARRK